MREEGHVPASKLLQFPGRRGEEKLFEKSPTGRYSEADWRKFNADIKRRGVRHAVTIHKDIDGKVFIHEGNHRLRAAAAQSLSVPVEISYFGNSQRLGRVLDT